MTTAMIVAIRDQVALSRIDLHWQRNIHHVEGCPLMILAGKPEAHRMKLLIHGADYILQALLLERYPAVMALLEVSVKGVLEGSGAVKDNLMDVHSALFQDFLQFVICQAIFGLISDNFGC